MIYLFWITCLDSWVFTCEMERFVGKLVSDVADRVRVARIAMPRTSGHVLRSISVVEDFLRHKNTVKPGVKVILLWVSLVISHHSLFLPQQTKCHPSYDPKSKSEWLLHCSCEGKTNIHKICNVITLEEVMNLTGREGRRGFGWVRIVGSHSSSWWGSQVTNAEAHSAVSKRGWKFLKRELQSESISVYEWHFNLLLRKLE